MGRIIFKRKAFKAGSSVAVTIPSELVKAYGLNIGEQVNIYSYAGGIMIEKEVKQNG